MDGERTFITMPGLELSMKEKWFEHIKINNYDYIYVSGYELERKKWRHFNKNITTKESISKNHFRSRTKIEFY